MKLLDYSGLQRFLDKIKTLLDSKSNTGHTHVTSEVTDLLNSQHTWSAQQSYSADLNLNYANTDVDDILDTVAGSYTAEDFLAQNNVWTGSNTWTMAQFCSQNAIHVRNAEPGVAPSSEVTAGFRVENANASYAFCDVLGKVNTSGVTYVNLVASNKFSNGALDPNGTTASRSLQVGIRPDGSGFIYTDCGWRNNLVPPLAESGVYSLGTSTNQWKSVYAKNYYYNGTAWGLDKANEWTNAQTYSAASYGNKIWLKNTGLDLSVNGNTGLSDTYQHMIQWVDKNQTVYSMVQSWTNSSENSLVLRSHYRTDANTIRDLSVRFTSTATNKVIYPETNADTELGTSTNQWKSVYAQSYYYNGTAWGLDKANTWSATNTYNGVVLLNSSSDVAEQFKQKLPKDVSVSSDALVRFNTLTDSEDHNVVVEALGHWASYVSKSTTLQYKNDSTKRGTIDFRLTSDGYGVFYPETPFECNLGNAGNQWKSVYAQSYYYNGTQWGLDQTNEWTGSNKFKSSNTNFGLQSTVAEAGSLTASSNWMYWQDKNGYQDAYISRDFWNDGSDTLRISISGKRANGAPSTSGTDVECGVRLDIAANGTKSVNPFVSNDTDLGSSALRWRNLYTSDVSTDLVESFPGGTGLVIRSTDQTWENGARMFLYSNTHTGQTNGSIYIDVDHGDGNNTKTGLTLIPNLFIPVGGGTTGISLGSSTNHWSSVYADSYYYGTTRWGLDQANTWTGANNFSILSLYSNSVTYNQAPSSNVELPSIRIFGGGKYCGAFDYVWSSTGENVIRLSLASYRSDGSFGYWACNFGVPRDFSNGGAFGTPAFYPNNKGYDLGTSTNQWRKVYSADVVHTSGNETITGIKTLIDYWRLQAKNLKAGEGETYGRTGYSVIYTDKNAVEMGDVTLFKNANAARTFIRIRGGDYYTNGAPAAAGTLVQSALMVGTNVSGKKIIECDSDIVYPTTNKSTDLGDSTHKWKTLNGINPGALSLPDQNANSVNLSGNITVLDGSASNDLTQTVNGWLFIYIENTTGAYIRAYIGSSSGTRTIIRGVVDAEQSQIYIFAPIFANITVSVYVKATSIGRARFYPCLGNV